MFDDFTNGVAQNDKARIAFIVAATWPDLIKCDSEYHNDGPHNGDVPPPGPDAACNIGYGGKLRHKHWYFVDIPFSPDSTPTQDAPVPNAQTQIPILRAAFADPNSNDDLKSYDMVRLLHLVGDVHQPLHATSRSTAADLDGDAGGNAVKIHGNVGNCRGANELHAFWDDLLGPSSGTSQAAAAAAEQLDAPDASRAAVADEAVWVQESFELPRSRPINRRRLGMATVRSSFRRSTKTTPNRSPRSAWLWPAREPAY